MFELPKEYVSLLHMTSLGDINRVKYACEVWNSTHYMSRDNVRIDYVEEHKSHIRVTGRCSDVEALLQICQYLTAIGVWVSYEKTIISIEV
jgi:hypothetical protein